MYKQGKIVLIPFPFTNLSGQKVRPAVILSVKSIGDDAIVAFISTNTTKKEKFSVLVKRNKENGLKSDSVIIVSKIATLEKKMILGEIGALSHNEIELLKTKIKDLLF